jgi:hypothetical protein
MDHVFQEIVATMEEEKEKEEIQRELVSDFHELFRDNGLEN